MLLYWHVYGLDAFHCLDRKQISHIPDNDTNRSEILPQHDSRDYLDAILALAIIARKIVQTLCSSTAKRQGVEPKDVHNLYEQINHWRNSSCPRHLQRREDSTGKPAIVNLEDSNAGEIKNHTQLRRAALWALEINCLLQIECCVSDYGIQDGRGLEAEATAIRVEFESVRALNDMINICRWMEEHEVRDQDDQQHSLPDLAPYILRNTCAGTCFWSCQRGIEISRRGLPSLLQSSHSGAHGPRRDSGADGKKGHINTYAETAQLLRDVVATATSHKDTVRVLQRLDQQRHMLMAALGDISP